MINYRRSVFASVACATLLTLLIGGTLIATRAHSSLPVKAAKSVQADSAIAYKDLSHSEKKEYMRNVVTPQFAKLFAAFDAKRFPTVKCVTCHGDGARTSEFKMPDAKLPKIPKTEAGLKKLEAKKPAMVKFMRESVAPLMASQLGMKEYKCEGCHVMK